MYEYACGKCGHQFEKLVKSASQRDDSVACPECASTETARKLSVFAAVSGDGGAKSAPGPMPGCGRCGGPGPCGMN
jgi:putative FmdB family regulatory protein